MQTRLNNYFLKPESIRINEDKFKGALIFSAIGDALGWPQEFKRRLIGKTKDFISWNKLVGGRWWGYYDKIQEGGYSDDTQLTLSVARCINEFGVFDLKRFSFLELPLWLTYQRGGGVSVKFAAKELLRKKFENPIFNFYYQKRGERAIDYRNAGANGAAMRILPIALVNSLSSDNNKLLNDIWFNALVTHGHPRAILGAILYGFLIKSIIYTKFEKEKFLKYIERVIQISDTPIKKNEMIIKWKETWNDNNKYNFEKLFNDIKKEANTYLKLLVNSIIEDPEYYYSKIGALREFKGSGLSTVFAAIFLFLKYNDDVENGIITSANIIGSDTDTISYFLGGLYGTLYGISEIPKRFLRKIQDREYILKIAKNLINIASGNISDKIYPINGIDFKDVIKTIKFWELELRDIFWDDLNENDLIIHPVLGEGIIQRKEEKNTKREDFIAKIIEIKFNNGQTCCFHSRVNKYGAISESLIDVIRLKYKDKKKEIEKKN
ncbi:MAG: ADP-ribosylglycohydrolase family protein [Promethearchaeota archaeon]